VAEVRDFTVHLVADSPTLAISTDHFTISHY